MCRWLGREMVVDGRRGRNAGDGLMGAERRVEIFGWCVQNSCWWDTNKRVWWSRLAVVQNIWGRGQKSFCFMKTRNRDDDRRAATHSIFNIQYSILKRRVQLLAHGLKQWARSDRCNFETA